MQIVNQVITNCWYAQTTTLLQSIGLDIMRVLQLTVNKETRDEIYSTYLKTTWIEPKDPLSSKLLHYSCFYLQIENGQIITLEYISMQMS